MNAYQIAVSAAVTFCLTAALAAEQASEVVAATEVAQRKPLTARRCRVENGWSRSGRRSCRCPRLRSRRAGRKRRT